jgi:hypothetical protein
MQGDSIQPPAVECIDVFVFVFVCVSMCAFVKSLLTQNKKIKRRHMALRYVPFAVVCSRDSPLQTTSPPHIAATFGIATHVALTHLLLPHAPLVMSRRKEKKRKNE